MQVFFNICFFAKCSRYLAGEDFITAFKIISVLFDTNMYVWYTRATLIQHNHHKKIYLKYLYTYNRVLSLSYREDMLVRNYIPYLYIYLSDAIPNIPVSCCKEMLNLFRRQSIRPYAVIYILCIYMFSFFKKKKHNQMNTFWYIWNKPFSII